MTRPIDVRLFVSWSQRAPQRMELARPCFSRLCIARTAKAPSGRFAPGWELCRAQPPSWRSMAMARAAETMVRDH